MTSLILCALLGFVAVHAQDQHDPAALFKANTERLKASVLATGKDITSPLSMFPRPKSTQQDSGSQLRAATVNFIHCGGASDCSITYMSPLMYVPGVEIYESRYGILSYDDFNTAFCTGSNPVRYVYRLGECSNGMKVTGVYWEFNTATNIEELAGANYSYYSDMTCSGEPHSVYFNGFPTNPSCYSSSDYSSRYEYYTTWSSFTSSLPAGVLTKFYNGKWACRLGGPLGVDTGDAYFEPTNQCRYGYKVSCAVPWPGRQRVTYSYFENNVCTTSPYSAYTDDRKYCQKNGLVYQYTYCKPY